MKKHQGNEGKNQKWCVYDIVEAKDSFLNVCQQPDYYKKKEKDLFNINVRCWDPAWAFI